jgi:molecular chaperone DnaJ
MGGASAGGFSSMEEALRTFMGAFGDGGGGNSIFESFFGGGGGYESETNRKGASKKVSLTVTFEEALRGVEKELAISTYVSCAPCGGSGAKSKNAIKSCSSCQGKGQVFQNRGFFSMTSVCPHCHGSGQMITDPCKSCSGAGRIKDKQRVKIRIPAGVDSGMSLKMSGYGDAGEGGGPNGDLFVSITVRPHDTFHREGNDILLELPTSFVEATLGCKKELPTLLGETVRLTIPEGTQTGKVLRISGKGFPNVHGKGHGDLLVKILVETPVRLSDRQKEILRSFEELETQNNHPRKKSFSDKVKEFFS